MRDWIGTHDKFNAAEFQWTTVCDLPLTYNLTILRSFLTILDADLVIVMIADRKSYLLW